MHHYGRHPKQGVIGFIQNHDDLAVRKTEFFRTDSPAGNLQEKSTL